MEMSDTLCPDCAADIDVPDDAVLSEIVSCPDCGLDLEVISIDSDKIELIVAEIRNTLNTRIVDIQYDSDYNRAVITFVGTPEAVLKANVAAASKAIEIIDMNDHKGQHPRIGAIDVVPFVPAQNVTMEECIELSKKFAEIMAGEGIPVYLYEESAKKINNSHDDTSESVDQDLTEPANFSPTESIHQQPQLFQERQETIVVTPGQIECDRCGDPITTETCTSIHDPSGDIFYIHPNGQCQPHWDKIQKARERWLNKRK